MTTDGNMQVCLNREIYAESAKTLRIHRFGT